MNSEEQTLIDGLFSRLQQAETDSAPRDALAEARIKEHMTRQPAAGYYMTQSILVQEHALKSLDAQNKQQAQQIQQLQDELQQAKSQASQPAPSSGGFLSSIFGGGSREPQPVPASHSQFPVLRLPTVAAGVSRRGLRLASLRRSKTTARPSKTINSRSKRPPLLLAAVSSVVR